MFQDLYVAFAEDPVNGLPKMGWGPYTDDDDGMGIVIGAKPFPIEALKKEEFDRRCEEAAGMREVGML